MSSELYTYYDDSDESDSSADQDQVNQDEENDDENEEIGPSVDDIEENTVSDYFSLKFKKI
jgi:hypothetical protein